MNAIQTFIDHAMQTPTRPALWDVHEGVTTFGEVYRYAAKMQTIARSAVAKKGDYVLIFGKPGAGLYGAVIGLLGLGCSAIFIEPWMALSEIEEIIAQTKPKIYMTNLLGRLWGMRIKAIRQIPVWISENRIKKSSGHEDLAAIELPEDHVGFLTFTTGTTGRSKGVVRTHGGLVCQSRVLSKYLSTQGNSDLCVLPNFILLNLSLGKSSVFVTSDCRRRVFKKIPEELRPSSVSCGPGFLQKLIENADCFPHLNSFHIGGALAECSLYEKGFETWPSAEWIQVYGSSEAEPVATADAREVVKKCRARSYHQTVYLGAPIAELKTRVDEGVLWVSGAHVSPFYFGGHSANQTHKKRDASLRLWHNMGDRILVDEEGWWYQGRSTYSVSDFILEQQVSSFLKTNDVLIANHTVLLGTGVGTHKEAILKQFPVINDVIECKIYRDRRHRARIDREKTIKKGAPWITGGRWLIFIKERFSLIPQLILTGGMALIAYHKYAWVLLGLLIFFFLLRAMDEYKDYEKDCVAHPERPLPRGLISRNEMKGVIQFLLFGMVGLSVLFGSMISIAVGLMYFIVTGYLWAMFHEFNLKSFLSKKPLIYTLSHQLIIVPLSAFLIAAHGGRPILSTDTLFVSMVLFGGFFAYEICRKLDPEAHPLLKTYPQTYGSIPTALLAAAAVLVMSFGAYFLGVSLVLWPIGLLLLAALIYYCRNSAKFKIAEKISVINLLACIYSLGIKSMMAS